MFEPRVVVKVTVWGHKLPDEKIETSLIMKQDAPWMQTVADYVKTIEAFPVRQMEARVYEEVVLLA